MVKSVPSKAGMVLLIDKQNPIIHEFNTSILVCIISRKKLFNKLIKTKNNLVAFKFIITIVKRS